MSKCNPIHLTVTSRQKNNKHDSQVVIKKNCYYTENHLLLKCHGDVIKFKVDPTQFTAVNPLKAQW